MKKLSLICIIPTFFIITNVHAKETLRSVDASNFDIAGVKLGMDTNEAVSALMSKLKVSKDKLNYDSISRATGKPPRSIQVYIGKSIYSVFFGENIYNNKSPTIVTTVQVSGTHNLSDLKKVAIKKYGLPSGASNALMANAVWCKKPGKDAYFTCSNFDGPVLKLSGTGLWFSNRAYDKDYIKFQQKKKRSTPTL